MTRIEKKTTWFGKVNITISRLDNTTTYSNKETVSTNIERGEYIIVIHDNRTKTKEERQIVLGPALLEIKKGDYNDSFEGIFMYLRDTDRKKIGLEMLLEGATIEIRRDGQDVFDDIIA